MKILMTGATGFVGRQILKDITTKKEGISLHILTRNASAFNNPSPSLISVFEWKNPKSSLPPQKALEGVTHIIHLAGAPVAQGRWTKSRKQELYNSRILVTQNLLKGLEEAHLQGLVFLSSSAIGIYGDRGEEMLREDSPLADDFLGKLCQDWEKASSQKKVLKRVVHLRTGLVLGKGGGALSKMLPPFKMGVGGILGDGKHMMSWIHLKDLSSLFLYALENENVSKAVNAVSPHPVSNKEFTKCLGKTLKRPTIFPLPQFALNILFGEKSTILTASQKVSSQKAQHLGFSFHFPTLTKALEDILKK